MATKIADFDVEDLKIQSVKPIAYGINVIIRQKNDKPVLLDFGEVDTVFGASAMKDEKTGKTMKPKIDVEIGFEAKRTPHQQSIYDKVQQIRKKIIDLLLGLEDDKKLSGASETPYTRAELEGIVVNPIKAKRGKKKKKNAETGAMEIPVYAPKLKLGLQFPKIKKGDTSVEDDTRVKEMYDETKPKGQRGNHLFFDEDRKPLSVMVDDLQTSIPPNSTLHCYVSLSYMFVTELDSKESRTAYMVFQPVSIQRLFVKTYGMELAPTLFEESYDDLVLESGETEAKAEANNGAIAETNGENKTPVYSEDEENEVGEDVDDEEEVTDEE